MSREEMLNLLDVMERRIVYGQPYGDLIDKLRAALSEPKKCKYGDPMCPCQDGDMCHYEGENPMTPPASEPVQEPVAWMNPAANVFARHKEGADNFGCTVPLYAAPQGYVLVPVEPSQEYWDKAWAQIRCDGHITGSASVVQIKRMFDACHTAMLSAAKGGE